MKTKRTIFTSFVLLQRCIKYSNSLWAVHGVQFIFCDFRRMSGEIYFISTYPTKKSLQKIFDTTDIVWWYPKRKIGFAFKFFIIFITLNANADVAPTVITWLLISEPFVAELLITVPSSQYNLEI